MDAARQLLRDQAAVLLHNNGRPVQFQRDANPAIELRALISLVNDSCEDRDGYVVTFESWDFICFTEDLAVAGVATLPAIGDKLTDDTGAQYQVQPIPSGKHYRYADSHRTMIRVHTKMTGEPS